MRIEVQVSKVTCQESACSDTKHLLNKIETEKFIPGHCSGFLAPVHRSKLRGIIVFSERFIQNLDRFVYETVGDIINKILAQVKRVLHECKNKQGHEYRHDKQSKNIVNSFSPGVVTQFTRKQD